MYPCWSLSENLSNSCNFTHLMALIYSPFVTWTGCGVRGSETSLQYGSVLRFSH